MTPTPTPDEQRKNRLDQFFMFLAERDRQVEDYLSEEVPGFVTEYTDSVLGDYATQSDIDDHNADTTGVHGITDTADLAYTDDIPVQNLYVQETDPGLTVNGIWVELNPDDTVKTIWVNVV